MNCINYNHFIRHVNITNNLFLRSNLRGIFFYLCGSKPKNEAILNNLLIKKLGELFHNKHKQVSIVVHTNPDGDAIGSALGLRAILKNIGFTWIQVIAPNAYPSFLQWMPGNEEVIIATEQPHEAEHVIAQAEILFCLDFNGFSRAEQLQKNLSKSKALKIMIDHHPQPEDGFDLVFSDTKASSTAEMVYEVVAACGMEDFINLDAAQCLYAGIVTDTGSFSFSCNNPRTYEITAELVRKGVDGASLQRLIYNTYSLSRMRMLGYSLAERLTVYHEHHAACISLTKADLDHFNHKEGDTEGFVNYALSIKDVRFAALFIEKDDHTKVSLRSAGDLDVSLLARKYYEGGGHRNASGGKSMMDMENTLKHFERLLNKENL